MGCELVFVRHGETEWNRESVFRGRKDVPLNDRGRRQAELAARALADAPVRAVYSSPLSRAADTAAVIARAHGLEVIENQDLIDIYYGAWEGLTLEEVEDRFSVVFGVWRGNPDRIKFPQGGEGLKDAGDRAHRFLKLAADRHRDDMVVVVSHRVSIKVAIMRAVGCPLSQFWSFRIDTASITRLQGPGRWALTAFNDTHHLTESCLTHDF